MLLVQGTLSCTSEITVFPYIEWAECPWRMLDAGLKSEVIFSQFMVKVTKTASDLFSIHDIGAVVIRLV